jgi:hypothetical protein
MHSVIGAIIVANSCVVSRADIVTAMTTQLTGCHHMPTRAVAPTATLARVRLVTSGTGTREARHCSCGTAS